MGRMGQWRHRQRHNHPHITINNQLGVVARVQRKWRHPRLTIQTRTMDILCRIKYSTGKRKYFNGQISHCLGTHTDGPRQVIPKQINHSHSFNHPPSHSSTKSPTLDR